MGVSIPRLLPLVRVYPFHLLVDIAPSYLLWNPVCRRPIPHAPVSSEETCKRTHDMTVPSEANVDEAARCIDLAEECVRKLQFEKAVKYCKQAARYGWAIQPAFHAKKIRLHPGSVTATRASRLMQSSQEAVASGRAPRISETTAPGRAAPRAPEGRRSDPSAAGGGTQPAASSASSPPPPPTPSPLQEMSFAGTLRRCARRTQRFVQAASNATLAPFGIVPSYRIPVFAVYSAIVVVLLYKMAFVWPEGTAGNAHAHSHHRRGGRAMPSHTPHAEGWNFIGFMPGDVSYVSDGFSFFAPFGTMMLFSIAMNMLGAVVR